MTESYLQVPADGAGKKLHTRQRAVGANTIEDQFVIPIDEKVISFSGRAVSFKTPGRAAVSQNLFALHNATASTVLVNVNRFDIDLLTTVAKLATIISPILRLYRFTAVPTNGTSLTKAKLDSAQTSSSSVTAWGDASADRTLSGTTLTITKTELMAQTYGPRMLTAVGYEQFDRHVFFEGERDVTLRALEGLVVVADDAVVTTGNPATDYWACMVDWDEYQLP